MATMEKTADSIRPPATSIGVIGWIRANLFNGWLNSILSLLVLYLLWSTVPAFVKWAFIDSLWFSTSEQCKAGDGACWSIITANIRFILFGFYPHQLQWRPLLAVVILILLLFFSQNRKYWKNSLAYAWLLGLFSMGLLLKGGLFGLETVDSDNWGGLPLTLLLFNQVSVVDNRS